MDLQPHAEVSYLAPEERAAIEDAFVEAGVEYDRVTRARLLDGVNRRFVADWLPLVGPDPRDQLFADLRAMNRFEQLADGTVPLAQWLRNAARRFSVLSQRTLFEAALAKVEARGESTVVIAPEEAPSVDFEELITDGVDDLQEVAFLKGGADRVASVMKLLVPRYDNGKQIMLGKDPYIGAGTGWLIASDLVMTNYHVIRNRLRTEKAPSDEDVRLQVLGTSAHFYYDTDEAQGKMIPTTDLVAVGKGATEDFALLRLGEKPGLDLLPVLNEKVEVPPPEETPKGTIRKALAVNIIQHPGGGPKRVALRNNLVYRAEYPRLHYFTDTLAGSSGSPVLDDTWRVIALHRAYTPAKADFNGRTLGYVNEGIQIHAVLAAIEEAAKTDERASLALAQIRAEQTAWKAP